MNTLEQLNQWNDSISVSYTDLRIHKALFNIATPINQQVITNEGSSFISPVGIEILDIINPSLSQPTYTINLSTGPTGINVVWDTVPEGCVVTQVTSTIWQISGINSTEIWNTVKNPTIELPGGLPESYFGTFVYTASIDYIDGVAGAQSKTWNVNTVVLDVDILNQPLETVYKQNSSNAVDYPPTIAFDDNWPGAIWTLVGTPDTISSIENWTSTSSLGGTFTVNNTTKVFTIVGTTPQVNEYVNNLRLESNFLTLDFIVTYVVTNNIDSITDSKIQTFRNSDTLYLSNPTESLQYYSEDAFDVDINGTPLITNLSYTGDGIYNLTISSSDPLSIQSLSAEGTEGTSIFDPNSKVLTISGTKTQVNNRLANLKFTPSRDYESDFVLIYTLTTPEFYSASKLQNIICNSVDIEITNLSLSRNYIGNTENLIFSTNTPQITDFDTTESNTYGFTLNCSFGEWGINGTSSSNPFTYSGTKAQINTILNQVRFYPNLNVSANGSFTFTYIKNGVSQFTNTISLNGTAGSFPNTTLSFITTQNWTPTPAQVKYSKITNILLIGGGGGGQGSSPSAISGGGSGGGGGGGGGGYLINTEIILENISYPFTVGAGGVGGAAVPNVAGGKGGATSAFGYTIEGGEGGKLGDGGKSGPLIGSSNYDHSGLNGGLRSRDLNNLGSQNAGGGGGHLGIVVGLAKNGSYYDGGRGGNGFDDPEYGAGGSHSYWAAGGGGGGSIRGSAGFSMSAGNGGSPTQSANPGINGTGGGGGGGFNGPGGKGGDGLVRIRLVAK